MADKPKSSSEQVTVKQEEGPKGKATTLKGPARLFGKSMFGNALNLPFGAASAGPSLRSPLKGKPKKKTAAEITQELGILANIDRLVARGMPRSAAVEQVSRNLSLGNRLDILEARKRVLSISGLMDPPADSPEGRPAAMEPVSPSLVAQRARASGRPVQDLQARPRQATIFPFVPGDLGPDPNFPAEMSL